MTVARTAMKRQGPESPEAFAVSTPNFPIIWASPTMLQPTTRSFVQWSLTSGAQITRNGRVDPLTSNVTNIVYHNHTLFQVNTTPNWYYWNTATSDGTPGTPGWVLFNLLGPISLSATTYSAGAVAGTVIATVSVPMSSNAAGDTFPGNWGGTLTLGGPDGGPNGSFVINGTTLSVAPGHTLTNTQYNITISAQVAVGAFNVGNQIAATAFTLTQAGASAARVADFRDTLGVNTGVSDYKSPYVTNNAADTVTALQFMGITHVRDRMPGDGGFALANFWPKFPAAGIHADIMLTTTNTNVLNVANLIASLKTMIALGTGFVETIEHPNEPFSVAYTYNGVTNPTGVNANSPGFENIADFSKDMMTALAADSTVGPLNLPVLAASLAMNNSFIDTGLEFLTVQRSGCYEPIGTVLATACNLHIYPKYGNVTLQSVDATHNNLQQWLVDSFGNPTNPGNFAGYSTAQLVPLPKHISEWGNNTAPPAVGSNNRVTPTIQGKNNLTAWLNAFVQGYKRIFLFELFDNPGAPNLDEQSYGQFNSSHVAKASATYFHNFNTIVADNGGTAKTFTTGSLAATFSGLPSTGASTVLQASNGTFFIIVWNNVNNWNFSTATALTISPSTVTVNLPSSHTINVFDPTIGTVAQQTLTASSVTISLTDYAQIITVV